MSKKFLIKITIIAAAFLTGIAIGIIGMWRFVPYRNNSGSRESYTDRLITNKIAIVNLDEGVWVQDENVYYAEKLLINLDNNFLFTGLEDARQGYATGIYAGYMIIPAVFSESIVSLNDTPIRSEITYAINDSLREDIKEEVIYDVLTLMGELNDNVSYMYLHSVLDDYHTAQDEASTVMNNDIKEKEAIDAIKANDLVALVPVMEFTEIENNIVPVDISEYMRQNIELSNQVGVKYKEFLLESETDHQRINEDAILLMTEMNNMDSLFNDISFGQDEGGNSIYQSGKEELDNLFEEYNTTLKEKEDDIGDNVIAIYEDINTFLDAYDRAIEANRTENEADYENILEELEKLFIKYQNSYVMVSTEEIRLMEEKIEEQNDKMIEQQNLIQELQDGVEDASADKAEYDTEEVYNIDEGEAREQETDESIGDEMFEEIDNETDETIDEEPPETINEKSDEAEIEITADNGQDVHKMQLYVAETEPEPINLLQQEIFQILGENYFIFSGYLLDEKGEAVKDENGDNVLLTSLLSKYQQELSDPLVKSEILDEQVGEIEKMTSDDVTACIDEKILAPIQNRVESFTTAILEQYSTEKEQLITYNNSIMEYDPLKYIDDEEIGTLTGQITDNGYKLSEAVRDTDTQQMEYVSEVYLATRNDLSVLRDNIIQAKEDSDMAVSEGLQSLKDAKNANSDENQMILYDFSTKLPYTRLGTLEYVQAYEFMVKPINVRDIEASEKSQITRTDSARAEGSSYAPDKRRIDYQDIVIILSVMICVIIVVNTIKYHFHKKEESYEYE